MEAERTAAIGQKEKKFEEGKEKDLRKKKERN
jgi:hypothetical protein